MLHTIPLFLLLSSCFAACSEQQQNEKLGDAQKVTIDRVTKHMIDHALYAARYKKSSTALTPVFRYQKDLENILPQVGNLGSIKTADLVDIRNGNYTYCPDFGTIKVKIKNETHYFYTGALVFGCDRRAFKPSTGEYIDVCQELIAEQRAKSLAELQVLIDQEEQTEQRARKASQLTTLIKRKVKERKS